MIRSTIFLFLFTIGFLPGHLSASFLPSRDFSLLVEQSSIVVLGRVEKVKLIEDRGKSGKTYRVTVEVASFLKGNASIKSLTLTSYIGGVKGFDIELENGAFGVFFLKSLKNTTGKLTYWGSIALFDRKYFR